MSGVTHRFVDGEIDDMDVFWCSSVDDEVGAAGAGLNWTTYPFGVGRERFLRSIGDKRCDCCLA